MAQSTESLRLGVIGDPVAHSLSPAFQQLALDAAGVPATFERWHTSAADLPARLAGLRLPDALGACVTVPHKVATMALVDEVNPAARRAGAVNTVVNRDGRLVGDNTDIHGFAASLAETGIDLAGGQAVVLGAGGAARAVALALEERGLGRIAVANRDPARARQLAAAVGVAALDLVPLDDASLRRLLPEAALLVNATALGWHDGEWPLAPTLLDLLPSGALVADLTYRDTDLLQAAAARGLPTLDGLPMLVHQGARAFALWTGQEAPLAVMFEAARRAQAARERAG